MIMVRSCHRMLPDGSRISAGFLESAAHPRFQGRHPEHRLLAVLSGSVLIHGHGTVETDRWFWRPAGWSHRLRRSPHWKEFYLVLPPSLIPWLGPLKVDPRPLPDPPAIEEGRMEQLVRDLSRAGSPATLARHVFGFLEHLDTAVVRHTEDSRDGDLLRELARLPHGPLPWSRWVEQYGLSAVHLRRRFRARHGHSPKAFHLRFLMERAASLLDEPGVSVQRVAEVLEFPDAPTFSKQFHRFMGRSPRDWSRPESR